MKSKALRMAGALFALCLILLSVPACHRARPSAENAIGSVTVDKKERVTVTASMNDRTLKEAPGKKAYLYELLPGESSIEGKAPIAEDKLAHNLKFTFSLLEGERSRLTSSFVVAFEDGTWLSSKACRIENPEKLAAGSASFSWESSPKGLNATDVEQAFETGAMHVMLKEAFSDLVGAEGGLSASAALRLDSQIRTASNAGMQVSMTLDVDELPSYYAVATLLSSLTARYNGGENGCISALFIPMSDRYDNALLCRLAYLTLCSQVANGRVYMISNAESAEQIATQLALLSAQLRENGSIKWGAAISPVVDRAAWLPREDGKLSVSELSELFSSLTDPNGLVKADFLAVCDLSFPSLSLDEQAVSLAYTYREAVGAGADLIFWGNQFGNADSLYQADGAPNRAASVFCDIDTGLSPSDLLLCESLAGDAWRKTLIDPVSRKTVTGTAALGAANTKLARRISFAKGDLHGFFSVSAQAQPITQLSAAFGEEVLLTWLDPSQPADSGIRKTFAKAKELKKISDLSIRLLTQASGDAGSRIALSLEGTAKDGTRLSYYSEVDVQNQSWQTVSFGISSFTQEVDPSLPCTLSLSAVPLGGEREPFVLFVRELDLHKTGMNTDVLLPVAVAVGTCTVVFAAIMVTYVTVGAVKKRRRVTDDASSYEQSSV
ncbi:MAG: hypothetical protein E7637_05200 [Ruminococcaceae bacterium]|nr:hypothetical protein [Oscillospiraceae bacterium]